MGQLKQTQSTQGKFMKSIKFIVHVQSPLSCYEIASFNFKQSALCFTHFIRIHEIGEVTDNQLFIDYDCYTLI